MPDDQGGAEDHSYTKGCRDNNFDGFESDRRKEYAAALNEGVDILNVKRSSNPS